MTRSVPAVTRLNKKGMYLTLFVLEAQAESKHHYNLVL